jgi:hypothetical protein
MTSRERAYERLIDRLSTLVEAGVCGSYTESEIDDLLDWYCDQFSLPDRLEREGEQYVIASLVFRFFERRGIAVAHDTELHGLDTSARPVEENVRVPGTTTTLMTRYGVYVRDE